MAGYGGVIDLRTPGGGWAGAASRALDKWTERRDQQDLSQAKQAFETINSYSDDPEMQSRVRAQFIAKNPRLGKYLADAGTLPSSPAMEFKREQLAQQREDFNAYEPTEDELSAGRYQQRFKGAQPAPIVQSNVQRRVLGPEKAALAAEYDAGTLVSPALKMADETRRRADDMSRETQRYRIDNPRPLKGDKAIDPTKKIDQEIAALKLKADDLLSRLDGETAAGNPKAKETKAILISVENRLAQKEVSRAKLGNQAAAALPSPSRPAASAQEFPPEIEAAIADKMKQTGMSRAQVIASFSQ